MGFKMRERVSEAELAKQRAAPENFQTIIRLENYIRQQKALTQMKRIITEERH